MLFRHRLERNERCDTGVGKEHVDTAELLLYLSEQAVQIFEVRNIAADARSPVTEFGDGTIQCFGVTAGDNDPGTVGDEPLGGGQADSTASSGDDRDFVVQLAHRLFSFSLTNRSMFKQKKYQAVFSVANAAFTMLRGTAGASCTRPIRAKP